MLYLSSDFGNTWQTISTIISNVNLTSVAISSSGQYLTAVASGSQKLYTLVNDLIINNLYLTGATGQTGGIGNVNNSNNNIYCNNVYALSAVYANNVQLTSDYRIKENVIPLDNHFKVDYLNPVTYTNKQTKKQDIGLIAHELQEYYPELVTGVKDGSETQSVNYVGLIPVLIHEIKNLKNEIQELKHTNQILETRISALEEK